MTDIDPRHVHWRKSSHSDAHANCVEVADLAGGRVAVRDAKDHGTGPILRFGPGAWDAFLSGLAA